MKINFPESLDNFNLKRTRAQKNAATRTNAIEVDDLIYIANELERKVGSNGSTDPASHDSRLTVLEGVVTALQSFAASHSAAIAALSSSINSLAYRSRRISVTTGGTAVAFPVPMFAGYIVFGACYNAAGETIGYSISNQLSTGFTVTPDQNGTFEWLAIPSM